MKTTLNLNPSLMRKAKIRAVETDRTLTKLVEDALRDLFLREERKSSYSFNGAPVRGKSMPGIDLDDRSAIMDAMEDRA